MRSRCEIQSVGYHGLFGTRLEVVVRDACGIEHTIRVMNTHKARAAYTVGREVIVSIKPVAP